jgi:molybdenum-dependent DNA-binding transcriptional regulator ModE
MISMKRQQPNESTTLAIAQALGNNKSIKQVAHNFGISYNSVWRISWLVKCGKKLT